MPIPKVKLANIETITDDDINISRMMVDVNDPRDKTGLYCFGKKAGINGGRLIIGWLCTVANPTNDGHFSEQGFAK